MNIQAQTGNIHGSVAQIKSGCLSGRICASNSIAGFVAKPVGYVDYTGTHEVTPKTTAQTLPTADKRLTDDITVLAIPFYEVSNTAGGSTFSVG